MIVLMYFCLNAFRQLCHMDCVSLVVPSISPDDILRRASRQRVEAAL